MKFNAGMSRVLAAVVFILAAVFSSAGYCDTSKKVKGPSKQETLAYLVEKIYGTKFISDNPSLVEISGNTLKIESPTNSKVTIYLLKVRSVDFFEEGGKIFFSIYTEESGDVVEDIVGHISRSKQATLTMQDKNLAQSLRKAFDHLIDLNRQDKLLEKTDPFK